MLHFLAFSRLYHQLIIFQYFLNGACLTSQLVYRRATVTNAVNEDMRKYIDLADTIVKKRHCNHKRDFKHQKYCSCTELAKYVRELKEKNITPIIKWEILSKVYGNPKQNICILCLTEKLWIINFIHDNITSIKVWINQ